MSLRRHTDEDIERTVIRLRESVDATLDKRSGQLVSQYFHDPDRFGAGFVGSSFESLGDNNADRFGFDDVAVLSPMGHRLRPAALRALMADEAGEFSRHLSSIPDNVDVWEADDAALSTIDRLFTELVRLPSVDWSTATSLLARKRPRLVLLYDVTVELQFSLEPRDPLWWAFRQMLSSEPKLVDRIEDLRPDQQDAKGVSVLRLLYVAGWMRASGTKAAREARLDAGLAPS